MRGSAPSGCGQIRGSCKAEDGIPRGMKTNAATVQLIKQLPKSIKAKLSIGDLQVIEGLATVVDRIAAHFVNVASMERDLRKAKANKGVCSGQVTCLNSIKKNGDICRQCREAKANPTHKNGRSEYGRIMRKRKLAEK
jgi:hypothetical protein